MKRLNLGCGHDSRDGWINLDSHKLPGVDIVHDIEDLPLPFKDQEFDEILAKDVLEHIDYIKTIRDLHRILKPGGILNIQVPHFTSVDNFIDPTHKKQFSIRTFEFFLKNTPHGRGYYFDFAFDRIEAKRIRFRKGLFFYNYPMEYLININDRMRELYELTGLSRLFPAQNMLVKLVK